MSSPRHARDPRSALVLDTRELGRRAGAMTKVRTTVPAPNGLGNDEIISVLAETPLGLDISLESVIEGVWVSGTATVTVVGECVRCLRAITEPLEVELAELFVYADKSEADEEVSQVEGDLIDLEPLLRDNVVLNLPFQPLCRVDCAGLCVICGDNLDEGPGHDHAIGGDPRWEVLRGFK